MLDNEFYTKLNQVGQETGMSPQDLLIVMFSEGGVNPKAKNPKGAVGLIQFAPTTLGNMGLSKREIANFTQKSAVEQLDYVKQYVVSMQNTFNHGQPFSSATKYYHANFYPATLYRWHGDDPSINKNVIVVSKFASSKQERNAYEENKNWLDRDKDGKITVGDLMTLLNTLSQNSKFQTMYAQLKTTIGTPSSTSEEHKQNISPNAISRSRIHKINPALVPNFLDKINKLLDSLASVEIYTNKYGNKFPSNRFLIVISSNNDISSKLEYANILCTAIKEELDADSKICTDNNNVEVECIFAAKKTQGIFILQEFCNAISDTFQYATKQIGEIKIETNIISNTYSYYKPLNIKIAEINNRNFKMKFLVRK